ncbi:hypothetical protein ACSD7O_24080 [Methylorubrum extorquens]|uniref:hypothetical protein n=1 Tax=Methylorubrum extorquens TaxID=408 RepID=UPI003F60491B
MKAAHLFLMFLLVPGSTFAQKIVEKDITWRKPEIYLGHREPCLKYAASKNAAMISADLIEDMGASVKVRCRLTR